MQQINLTKQMTISDPFNPIQDGGQKKPFNSFSLVTSTNKTFWILGLTLLPHCCKISMMYLVPSQIIELEPNALLKKRNFMVKSL